MTRRPSQQNCLDCLGAKGEDRIKKDMPLIFQVSYMLRDQLLQSIIPNALRRPWSMMIYQPP